MLEIREKKVEDKSRPKRKWKEHNNSKEKIKCYLRVEYIKLFNNLNSDLSVNDSII